jgi:hypothetical protein
LPARPPANKAGADAAKQTQFLLGPDLALFEQAMNLQLAVLAENRKARTASAAVIVSLWSRVFSQLASTCMNMCSGSYVSCPPLLRAALDYIAAQRSLLDSGFDEYEEWLGAAVSQARDHQALALDLGRYRAGSVLAEDAALGSVYRLLSDLSMPHFGSTALLVAPETGLEKMPIAFGDHAFHLGWAELISGWLLLLADSQIAILDGQEVVTVTDDLQRQIPSLETEIESITSNPRRCRVEEVDGRFLFLNFRRTASGQPRRVML